MLLLYITAAVVPGPNVVLIMQVAVNQTRKATLGAALGITSGVLLLASMAAMGLSTLLTTTPGLAQALRLAGAGYLILLGLHMWRRARDEPPDVPAADSAMIQSAYRRGLATAVTNPQTVLFFGSILSTVLPRGLPYSERLIFVAVIVVAALCWFSGLAYLLTSGIGPDMLARRQPLLNRVLSAVMVLLGVRFLIA